MTNRPKYCSFFWGRNGFAMIVTLGLMILLMVTAMGLLSLATITLRSSSLSSARQTAQANARMAMMIAVGQLQLYAGADQRITATADIAAGTGGSAAADSVAPTNANSLDARWKGLTAVQPGTRYWTGIWKNRDASTLIYSKTPAPELMNWLVSGNEVSQNAVTPDSARAALKPDGSIHDPEKLVILAGGRSAGNKTTDAKYYVCAPLVQIKGTDSSSSSKTVGRYAWWVGDEGVKAKFNLIAPYSSNDVAKYGNFSTQRSGWEVVAGFNNYPLPGSSGSKSLSGVVSMSQSSLLPNAAANALSFHSATTDSFGVIADVLQGGLRYDLTSGLRQPLQSSPLSTIPNALCSNRNIVPLSVVKTSTHLKGPKWDQLKVFNDMSKTLNGGSLQVKSAATVNDYAIAPTIVDLRLLLGAKLVPSVPPVAHQIRVFPCAKIAVTLANPYSYPLRWDGLDLEIKNSFPDGINVSRIWPVPGQPAYVPKDAGEPAVFNKAIFRIGAGTLQAGAAMAYSMTGERFRALGSGTSTVVVPLDVESAGSLLDFKKSLVLETSTNISVAGDSVISMDVREATVTSMIDVELRPQGSQAILRKLERFELDNSEYEKTNRRFGSVEKPATATEGQVRLAKDFTASVPLQLYSFQLSQPGSDYKALLPNPASDLGVRSSTLRTYADFNLQATRFRKTNTCYNPAPYFMTTANQVGYLPCSAPGGETGSKFTDGLAISPIHWGRNAFQAEKTVLFSPPAADELIVSLAQFQHADLTGDDIYASVAHQPGNAFGNSYASPFLLRQNVSQSRTDYRITTGDWQSGVGNAISTQTNYYDISYLLNTALWDSYFCSTISPTGLPATMNQKLVKIDAADESPDLRDPAKVSSRLMINGAFNINSTSKDAWKAFLAGTKHLKHPADTTSSADALFARSLGQASPGKAIPTGEFDDSFAGFRRLNDSQIDALAEEITRQVRLRGPFVSLSHFVNRALVRLTINKELGRSGALQSALDNSGINISPDGTKNAFTNIDMTEEKVSLQTEGSNPRADLPGSKSTSFPPASDWPLTTRAGNPGTIAGIVADRPILTSLQYRSEQGFRSTGIPGWLTQADILQVIGPSMSARSDTFKIRSYGEALDGAGIVIARAWCEATVQRIPNYVSPENLATDRDPSLSTVNKIFGRKFNLISFQWLSPSEI